MQWLSVLGLVSGCLLRDMQTALHLKISDESQDLNQPSSSDCYCSCYSAPAVLLYSYIHARSFSPSPHLFPYCFLRFAFLDSYQPFMHSWDLARR